MQSYILILIILSKIVFEIWKQLSPRKSAFGIYNCKVTLGQYSHKQELVKSTKTVTVTLSVVSPLFTQHTSEDEMKENCISHELTTKFYSVNVNRCSLGQQNIISCIYINKNILSKN